MMLGSIPRKVAKWFLNGLGVYTYDRRAKNSGSGFYHGSRHELPLGKVLKAKTSRSPFNSMVEKAVERHRPSSAPPRNQAFFLASRPSQIDALGGSTEHVYVVEPGSDSVRVDSGWLGSIQTLLMIRKADGDPLSEKDKKVIDEYASSYWAGKKSTHFAGWEYLTSSIKAVRELKQ